MLIHVLDVRLMDHLCYLCLVVFMLSRLELTCWERADPLALVCDVKLCFYRFPMWCGTLLYRFLIFAAFLTYIAQCPMV